MIDTTIVEPVKRKPGRPRKDPNAPVVPRIPKRLKEHRGIDTEAREKLHGIVQSVTMFGNLFMPELYRLRPNNVNEIFLPLENILLRHMPEVGDVNPDLADMALFLYGVGNYAEQCGLFNRIISGKPVHRTNESGVNRVPESQVPAGNFARNSGSGNGAHPESDISAIMQNLHQSVTVDGAVAAHIDNRPNVGAIPAS
jgi:hypothetical protein